MSWTHIYSKEQIIFDELMFSHGWWLALAVTLHRCIVSGSVESAGEENGSFIVQSHSQDKPSSTEHTPMVVWPLQEMRASQY